MKKYSVVIHYEGAISFEIKAHNTTEAEQLAEELFDKMNDRELVENLAEISIYDVWEI